MVAHPERDDCYIARLVVKQVSPADSRRYYLNVENVHGNDRYAVSLLVKGNENKTFKRPIKIGSGWGFTKLLTQIFEIFCNFGP